MPNGDDTPRDRFPPPFVPRIIFPGTRPARFIRPGVVRQGDPGRRVRGRRSQPGPPPPIPGLEGPVPPGTPTPTAPPPTTGGPGNVPFLPLPPDLVPGTPGSPPGTPPPDVPGRPIPRPVPGVPPFIGRTAVILGRATIATGIATIAGIIVRDLILGRQDRRIRELLERQDAAIDKRLDELRRKQLITEPFVGPAPGTTGVGTDTGKSGPKPVTTIVVRDITRPGTSGIQPTAPRPKIPPPPPPQIPAPTAPDLPSVSRPEIPAPTLPEPVGAPQTTVPGRSPAPAPAIPGRVIDLVTGILTSPIFASGVGTSAVSRVPLAPGLITRPGTRPAVPTPGAPSTPVPFTPATPTIPGVGNPLGPTAAPPIPGIGAPPIVNIPTSVATATAAGIGSSTRVRTDDCQALARSRKRGRCREGFFKETPSGIRFTTWRIRNCRSGGVIAEK